jgi:hypothetical protein
MILPDKIPPGLNPLPGKIPPALPAADILENAEKHQRYRYQSTVYHNNAIK